MLESKHTLTMCEMFKERKMEGQKNKNEKYFGGKKNKKPAYEIKI